MRKGASTPFRHRVGRRFQHYQLGAVLEFLDLTWTRPAKTQIPDRGGSAAERSSRLACLGCSSLTSGPSIGSPAPARLACSSGCRGGTVHEPYAVPSAGLSSEGRERKPPPGRRNPGDLSRLQPVTLTALLSLDCSRLAGAYVLAVRPGTPKACP